MPRKKKQAEKYSIADSFEKLEEVQEMAHKNLSSLDMLVEAVMEAIKVYFQRKQTLKSNQKRQKVL